MQCWSCGKSILFVKIPFQAVCEGCGAYLHCCQNCNHFQEGLANNCKIPGTEPIADRQKKNFCEEFSPLGRPIEKKSKNTQKFNDLFR